MNVYLIPICLSFFATICCVVCTFSERHLALRLLEKITPLGQTFLNLKTSSRWKCSCYAITFQFSQCVVTLLAVITCISKSQLFNWQTCFVSEETAVFTPYIVIVITITVISTCAWVDHTACAHTTPRWCSTPVHHLSRITGHPPGISVTYQYWMITLVLNKLFTVWWDSGETRQLRETRSCVMNITCVTTLTFTSLHERSALTVVTDDCNANSIFVTHVTVNSEWCQASRAIWINNVISAYTTAVCPDFRTGSVILVKAFVAISSITRVTLAWIWSSFICTTGMLTTVICLCIAFI